jgi:hypothetical protein
LPKSLGIALALGAACSFRFNAAGVIARSLFARRRFHDRDFSKTVSPNPVLDLNIIQIVHRPAIHAAETIAAPLMAVNSGSPVPPFPTRTRSSGDQRHRIDSAARYRHG